MLSLILPVTLWFAAPVPQNMIVDTICSDPERARVLARATIILPDDNIDKLGDDFERISKLINMTTWQVGMTSEKGVRESLTLGLQSAKVSVGIEADGEPGQRTAKLQVKRTCINDDLEPWSGYWSDLKRELKARGYQLR
ncbi:hypothetical protein [Sphingomonas desiccabilis]|uniref:Uncharacterized protein n=1 Tax=Sphingomonas desiccabilis TaxID=429134 RepID=A0A4V1QP34_9SPHN|nr:hypothetical protein [Sphingomonas desiccabilis]MBB3911454.1 hypothetical protein [Sphingomonas desiccabilis]RXZ31774.1 hypothetical protein EO081_11265 [Sphingomonas desiccabilis]